MTAVYPFSVMNTSAVFTIGYCESGCYEGLCTSFCMNTLSILLGLRPESEIVGSYGNPKLNFLGTARLFSTVAMPFYIPTGNAQGFKSFHFPHPCPYLFFVLVLLFIITIIAILKDGKEYLIVVPLLICPVDKPGTILEHWKLVVCLGQRVPRGCLLSACLKHLPQTVTEPATSPDCISMASAVETG